MSAKRLDLADHRLRLKAQSAVEKPGLGWIVAFVALAFGAGLILISQ